MLGRILRVAARAIGLTAFAFLVMFGFAIWVFIPLLTAGIAYLIAHLIVVYWAASAQQARPSARELRKAA